MVFCGILFFIFYFYMNVIASASWWQEVYKEKFCLIAKPHYINPVVIRALIYFIVRFESPNSHGFQTVYHALIKDKCNLSCSTVPR